MRTPDLLKCHLPGRRPRASPEYRLVFTSVRSRLPLFTEVALRPPSVAVTCTVRLEHYRCRWTTHSTGFWQSELEWCNSSCSHHRRRRPPAASEWEQREATALKHTH